MRRYIEIFMVAFRLGLTSFGGPIAHLGYFHNEYVKRRQWLDDKSYADLVALCQFLPGPASSQVGIAIGMLRAGWFGGVVAWLGFTLPSAVALALFAYFVKDMDVAHAGWLHGLMLVAVAVVAQAVWSMASKLARGVARASLAVGAAVAILAVPSAFAQVGILAVAGLIGWALFRRTSVDAQPALAVPMRRSVAVGLLGAFFALLIGLPLLALAFPSDGLSIVNLFYRAGALVFGGGHVVLPLLQHDIVANNWLTDAQFLSGYGAAQAVPGPLFTIASYIGFASQTPLQGPLGSLLAVLSIFMPAYLLVAGTLPFWNTLRSQPALQAALIGINAAVVGLLFAALCHPLWTSAVQSIADFGLVALNFALLVYWKRPVWLVVAVSIVGGMGIGLIH